MKHFHPSPAPGLFRGYARVIKPARIEVLGSTVRKCSPAQPWEPLDELVEFDLHFATSCFSSNPAAGVPCHAGTPTQRKALWSYILDLMPPSFERQSTQASR